MPDRNCWIDFLTLGGVATFIALGKILKEDTRLRPRVIAGRLMCSAGLGGSSALLGFFQPDIPLYVQMGFACALATLGTDVVTVLIERKLGVDRE